MPKQIKKSSATSKKQFQSIAAVVILIFLYAPSIFVFYNFQLFFFNYFIALTIFAAISLGIFFSAVSFLKESPYIRYTILGLFLLKLIVVQIVLLVFFTPLFDFFILQTAGNIYCQRTLPWLSTVNHSKTTLDSLQVFCTQLR